MTDTRKSVAEEYGLLPCPFCGSGTFDIGLNGRVWTGMKWSEPASVSVRHWCPSEGRPGRIIERVGRDLDDAVAAWNMRATLR
jgi:hypothetical protein